MKADENAKADSMFNARRTIFTNLVAMGGMLALAACSPTAPASQSTPGPAPAETVAVVPTPPDPTPPNSAPDSPLYDDLMRLTSPEPGQLVTSPLVVTGQARGTWYFEASFPITLVDEDGTVLAQVPGQAIGEWMTEEFVPFTATLEFKTPRSATGELVVENANPSGESAHAQVRRIPLRFAASAR